MRASLKLLVTPAQLEPLILTEDREDSARKLRSICNRMEARPAAARALLDELLKWPNKRVRCWAVAIGADLFGGAFAARLVEAMRDRDDDVSGLALAELMKHDRPTAQSLIPDFRQRLLASDERDGTQLAFTLIELGDVDSVEVIKQWLSRPERWPSTRRLLDVGIELLLQGEQPILRRIRSHSTHDTMPFLLGVAVLYIGNNAALEAIVECAEKAPDEDCRRRCEECREILSSKLAGSTA